MKKPTLTVVDADQYTAAISDPKVIKLNKDAKAYAEKLVARGHCPCHLVMNCPDNKSAA